MILKDLETADKVLKKEPDETPPSSVDASPLQVPTDFSKNSCSGTHSAAQSDQDCQRTLAVRLSSSGYFYSLYIICSGGGNLLPGGLPHNLQLNGDLGQLASHAGGLDFAAAIAAAATSHQSVPSQPGTFLSEKIKL